MIYGQPPSFNELIGSLKELQAELRGKHSIKVKIPLPSGKELDDLIARAKSVELPLNSDLEGVHVRIPLTIPNTYSPSGFVTYNFHFIRRNNELVFEKIE